LSNTPNIAVSSEDLKINRKSAKVSIRVSPNSYLVSLFVFSFVSALLFYLGLNSAALFCIAIVIFVIPVSSIGDKIVVKNDSLYRRGLIPFLWSKIDGNNRRIKFSEIEQIETQAIRALKRSGKVFYRYRTSIRGNETHFAIASGGEDYRSFVNEIFHKVPIDVLDNRSIELRDYLAEPNDTLMKAEFARIPSTEVLASSLEDYSNKNHKKGDLSGELAENEKSDYLRRLANELRISGSLLQALEAFRRALLLTPNNAWLIFEFSRCLSSYAGVEKNIVLERRANAALRLAAKRSDNDSELLSRIGESFFQNGSMNRARICFQRASDLTEDSFRSSRGLAEISLREGKIAHVIHHFATAKRLVEHVALKNWASNEIDYFTQLNQNVDYMEAEVERINLLESFRRHKSMALRIIFLGLMIIAFGSFTEISTITNIGWTVATIALIVWITTFVGRNIFLKRIPIEVFDESENED
jgi:tetratricopeptide (TPR) repeat protein